MVAAMLCETAARAAAWNVRINLPMLNSEAQRREIAGDVERSVVEVRERRTGALLDDDRLEVPEQGVLACRADALVRQHAGDEDRLGVEAAQDQLEVRLEERRQAVLLDVPVLGAGVELVEQLVPPRPLTQAAFVDDLADGHERPADL